MFKRLAAIGAVLFLILWVGLLISPTVRDGFEATVRVGTQWALTALDKVITGAFHADR
jgi:hypothetical protein